MCCFIIVSAENQRQIVHGVIELQPDDYILKPFSFPLLKERMVKALKQKMALRKVFQSTSDNEFKEALKQCDLVIRDNTDYQLFAERLKGELLLRQQEYVKAEAFYSAIVQRQNLPWAELGVAIALLKQQRTAEAMLLFNSLADKNETMIEALDYIAQEHFKAGDIKSAFDILQNLTQLSPKNIPRQKTLANIAMLCHDFATAAKIFHRIVSVARHSIHDSAHNYLNHARCIIDNANLHPPIERANALGHVSKLLDSLVKRFNPEPIAFDLQILQVRLLSVKGRAKDAKKLLAKYQQLDEQDHHPETCLDAAKAYFETGDIFGCYHYVELLKKQLEKADFLTDSQRVLLQTEQVRFEVLYKKLQQLTAEATTAYQQQLYGRAVNMFCKCFNEMPTNPTIAFSLLLAIGRSDGPTAEEIGIAKTAYQLLKQAELGAKSTEKLTNCINTLKQKCPSVLA
ncbi:response regulator [Alishewanella longhuensis]